MALEQELITVSVPRTNKEPDVHTEVTYWTEVGAEHVVSSALDPRPEYDPAIHKVEIYFPAGAELHAVLTVLLPTEA